ncbi:MAG: pitrilysin family protein [Syntrophorhabdales bacterium]
MRRFLLSACLVVCSIAIFSGSAFSLPPIQRFVLDNGLVLLISEEHSLPFITFQFLVKTGSKDDPPGQEGLASLSASSLPLGCAGRTTQQIHEELDFMGAAISSGANEDYTAISLRALRKNVDRAFPIVMDILTVPTFPVQEVKKEISRTLGAIQSSEDQPGVVAEKAFEKALYNGGPYGHPAEGTRESVAKLNREMVSAFHRTYYYPNNTIVVVVGDVDDGLLKNEIRPMLEKWQRKAVPQWKGRTPSPGKGRTVKIDKPVTQSNIVIGSTGMSRDNPDYYAAQVMNYIFGGGSLSSRLMEDIRNKRGLAYSVSSYFQAQKHSGSFQVLLQTKTASTNESIAAVMEDAGLIRAELVSQAEIEDAKKYLVGSFPQRFGSQSKIASFFGQVEYYGLGLEYPKEYPSLINSVTREDVLRIARTYLNPDGFITVVVSDLEAAQGK